VLATYTYQIFSPKSLFTNYVSHGGGSATPKPTKRVAPFVFLQFFFKNGNDMALM
jgi:hypothetical protein